MPMTPEQALDRAQKAARARWHPDDPEAAERAERARLDEHIAAIVKSWPKMTPEQADRIRRLWNPPRRVTG